MIAPGIEPGTSELKARCSIQLSYAFKLKNTAKKKKIILIIYFKLSEQRDLNP